MMTEAPVREVRLKPEFAALYPGVVPDIWYTAATVAEHLLARFLHQEDSAPAARERILNDQHFEFRGEGGLKGGRIKLGE
jgi:hypothetical protein